MALHLLKEWLSRSNAEGSKSSVLAQPGWLIVTLLLANIGAAAVSVPFWLQAVLGALLVVLFFLWAGLLIYFSIKDPGCLRSERFVIEKLAIERGLVGDNETGLIRLGNEESTRPVLVQSGDEA